MKAKIYQMNEYDWWVAHSLKEAVEDYKKITGCDDSDIEDARPLGKKEMKSLMYFYEDGSYSSFENELQKSLKENRLQIPGMFCSTEY